MYLDVSNQAMNFVYAVLFGVGLGLIYEVLRILRIAFNFKNIAIFIQDVLYFLVCSPLLFVFMLNTTDGKVRIYIFVGAFLGFLLYYFTLGMLIRKISIFIINIIKLGLRKIYRYILYPVFKFMHFILKSIKKFLKHLQNKLKIVYNRYVYKYHPSTSHRRRNYFGKKILGRREKKKTKA